MRSSTAARRWRATSVAAALLAPLLLTAGPSSADELPENFPPVITNVDVSPNYLPATGGTVTVTVTAHDDDGGITNAFADGYGPYGGPVSTNLSWNGINGFSGDLSIPANYDEYDVGYQVSVWVHDTSGGSTEGFGSFTIAGTPPFDEAPIVWDGSAMPASLPAAGGPVALAVSAWDLRGISEAGATVTPSAGTPVAVTLEPIDRADRFHGTFLAPPNTTTVARTYTVSFWAMDDIGQQAYSPDASFTVAAKPAPVPGALALSPDKRTFGKVAVGTVARKTIELRRSKTRSSLPMTGLLTVAGPGFAIVGAGPAGLPFSLLPGQKTTVTVEFRPPSAGAKLGTLKVARADGVQPALAAKLEGHGKAPKR